MKALRKMTNKDLADRLADIIWDFDNYIRYAESNCDDVVKYGDSDLRLSEHYAKAQISNVGKAIRLKRAQDQIIQELNNRQNAAIAEALIMLDWEGQDLSQDGTELLIETQQGNLELKLEVEGYVYYDGGDYFRAPEHEVKDLMVEVLDCTIVYEDAETELTGDALNICRAKLERVIQFRLWEYLEEVISERD